VRARRLRTRSGGHTASLTAAGAVHPAGLARRLGASVYEALVLTALLLAVGFALLPLVTPAMPDVPRAAADAAAPPVPTLPAPGARVWSGVVLLAVCGAYCIGLWSGGRRTLPMATWRLELRTAGGGSVTPRTAGLRFLACGIGPALALAASIPLQPAGFGRWALGLLAVSYAWALFDPDRQFLQDRLAGTRLVVRPAPRG
jgi:uncharacterized RDD family membrane protein YckC